MDGDLDVAGAKRGRGRGRGTRARGGRGGRGRGRGRGKKAAVVVSSDEEVSLDGNSVAMEDAEVATATPVSVVAMETAEDVVMNKENEGVSSVTALNCAPEEPLHPMSAAVIVPVPVEEPPRPTVVLPQTIDMEADISQLEAPTFTTITRGPPEPMLRLKWDNKVNLIGEKVLNPMIHCCDQCDKPILLYGRMIPCKHVFCLKCARAEPVKVCPRCNDKVVRVEQSGLGTVFMCTHGGSRYGNTGCRRTYLSQRDLQAHINHRHVTQPPPPPPAPIPSSNDIKQDVMGMEALKSSSGQRKLSESSAAANVIQTPSALLLSQRPSLRLPAGIGNILPPGNAGSVQTSLHSHSTLTQANIARINTANAQECHQGKVALHQTLKKTPITQSHHQLPETVADASYYSSVLNSFGSGGNGPGGTNNTSSNTNSAAAVGYGYEPAAGMPTQPSKSTTGQGSWQQNQYYR